MRQIGLLGGSFDPIHNGHIKLALDAREKLTLEQVWLLPAGLQPLKGKAFASPWDRLEMCRLAVEGMPALRVLEDEVERPGPSYTVDTVRSILARNPDTAITFLAGTEALITLPSWKEPEILVSLCRVVGVERNGVNWDSLIGRLPGSLAQKLVRLDVPVLPVSSTEVRDRVAKGLPISHLVPPAVEKYIIARNLYTEGG